MLVMFIRGAGLWQQGKNYSSFELFNKEKTHRFPGCSNVALKEIVEVSSSLEMK